MLKDLLNNNGNLKITIKSNGTNTLGLQRSFDCFL
jgi:hypothetical protein